VLRPNRAEVEIHRRRTRTAVQGEGHRSIGAVDRVGREHDVARFLPVCAVHRQRAHGGGVAQGVAIELDRLVDVCVGGERRLRISRRSLFGRGGRRGRRGLLGEGATGKNGNQKSEDANDPCPLADVRTHG